MPLHLNLKSVLLLTALVLLLLTGSSHLVAQACDSGSTAYTSTAGTINKALPLATVQTTVTAITEDDDSDSFIKQVFAYSTRPTFMPLLAAHLQHNTLRACHTFANRQATQLALLGIFRI